MQYNQTFQRYKKGKTGDRKKAKLNIAVHLPTDYPWKVLAALLTDLEDLIPSNVLETYRNIVRKRDVAALLENADRFGLQSINKSELPGSTDVISAVYQVSALLKRFRFDTEKETRVAKAKEKFLLAEAQCQKFNTDGAFHLARLDNLWDQKVLTYVRSFCANLLGQVPDWFKVSEWSRHGPGSTLSTQDGHTSAYDKFAEWPYSCTKAAQAYTRQLILDDERWFGALQDDYRSVMEIPKWMPLNMDLFWVNVMHLVEANRITTVPKDARTERTIAIEPTLNLMLQLGVDGFIRRRLKSFGVDLDDQTINQKLAKIASIDGSDGNFATLDLAAASDTVSVSLLKLILPPIWFSYLMHIRSPQGDFHGMKISYEKISSMGNGYTFAIESMVFTAIIYAVHRAFYVNETLRYAVYGDDLIVPGYMFRSVVNYLGMFGFTTNQEKTFHQGPIRESCGTDWFKGQNIRPVFLTEVPRDTKALFSDANRLMRKMYRFGIFDSSVVKLIHQWIPTMFKDFVGPLSDEEFDTYIHSPYPNKGYANYVWRFKRLISIPVPQTGSNFLYRKLMATLRQSDRVLHKPAFHCTDLALCNFISSCEGSGGSIFTVSRRNRQRVGVSPASTSVWLEDYDYMDIRLRPRV